MSGGKVRHRNEYGYDEMINASSLPLRDCSCNLCRRAARSKSRTQGTQASSNFRSVPQRDDPFVTNHFFNTPGDGDDHGHVKEQKNPDGTTSYPFIRDVEGNEYDPV